MAASYVKLFKVCQDCGLGLQTINAAKDNLEAFLAAWGAEHAPVQESISGSVDPYEWFGRHDTPQVPRAMVGVSVAAGLAGSVAISLAEVDSVVLSVGRLAVGTWLIGMASPLELFFGDPIAMQDSNTPTRFCSAQTGGGLPSSTAPNSLLVVSYELAGGDFVPADYDFSCGIYSYH